MRVKRELHNVLDNSIFSWYSLGKQKKKGYCNTNDNTKKYYIHSLCIHDEEDKIIITLSNIYPSNTTYY